jgi:hypothetical protein
MCSSRLDPPSGIVTISAPYYSWAPVSHRLAVVGSAAEYGIRHAESAIEARFARRNSLAEQA